MQPFDYQHFRAAIMAAFIAQDWDAVGNALAIIQDVTGTTVLGGDPAPAAVHAWAMGVCETLAADGAYLDAHGEAHPRLQCSSPAYRTHGNAVRSRLARKHAQALAEAAAAAAPATTPADEPETVPAPTEPAPRPRAMTLTWGPPVPGVH